MVKTTKTPESSNMSQTQTEQLTSCIYDAVTKLSNAITPGSGAIAAKDESGGFVASLTEAVMGVTAGLCKIAEAIDGLSEAVREHGGSDAEDA